MGTNDTASTNPIDPSKVLAGALVFTFERRNLLARPITPAFAVYLLCAFIETTEPVFELRTLNLLIGIAAQVYIGVKTHRIFLLAQPLADSRAFWLWTTIEWRYLFQTVLLSLTLLPAFLFNLAPTIGPVLSTLVAGWLWARGAMALPATAIGQPVSIADSWQLTKDDQWPLLIVLVAFPCALFYPLSILRGPAWGWLPRIVLETLMIVLTTGALSLAYREVLRRRATSNPEER